jgi:4-hydroxybenzoate polyprenyltransferase
MATVSSGSLFAAAHTLAAVRPYVRIARPDHWFKNAFMLLGVLVAFSYEPSAVRWENAWVFSLAVVATCLIASSNYVLNEILDAATDRFHPTKRTRPVAAGLVSTSAAYLAWVALALGGFAAAGSINRPFLLTAMTFWLAGLAYNIHPVRLKAWPYLDVLSEAANNPIRLLLGWFAVIDNRMPSVSLLLAYWMAGAFFMAAKRLAERRYLGSAATAASYRRSFRHYTEERLLVSIIFYATSAAFFGGIFVIRYHLELILGVPLIAGVFAYYLKMTLQADSPAQHPERLYKHRGFVAYVVFCFGLCAILLFTKIPELYDWLHVEQHKTDALWVIERP